MDTSIERIRAKITELEARLTDLRIAERELLALEAAPAPKPKRRPKAKGAAGARQTVGAAIAEVLTQRGALPAGEIAGISRRRVEKSAAEQYPIRFKR